jgi:hypothetical protein
MLSPRIIAAVSTDSLLLQSRTKRFLAISREYQQAMAEDTTKANRLKKELGNFIKRKGDEKDWLLFEIAILNIERDRLLHNDLFVKRAEDLLHRGEQMQDTLIMAKVSLMRGLYEFNQEKNLGIIYPVISKSRC